MQVDPKLWDALSDDEKAAITAAESTPEVIERDRPQTAPAESDWAELEELEDLDGLPLSYRGRHYLLPPADLDLGLYCQRVMSGTASRMAGRKLNAEQADAEDKLDDAAESNLYQRLLGGDTEHPFYDPERDMWAKARADRLPWPVVAHMGTTAIFWAGISREVALHYWRTGGSANPKAFGEPAGPRQPTDHKGTGGTTRRQGSGSSTTKKRAARKKAAGSPGPSS